MFRLDHDHPVLNENQRYGGKYSQQQVDRIMAHREEAYRRDPSAAAAWRSEKRDDEKRAIAEEVAANAEAMAKSPHPEKCKEDGTIIDPEVEKVGDGTPKSSSTTTRIQMTPQPLEKIAHLWEGR